MYWQAALYSSPVGWANAQKHYCKGTKKMAQVMPWKKSVKVSFVTSRIEKNEKKGRWFSVFAQ